MVSSTFWSVAHNNLIFTVSINNIMGIATSNSIAVKTCQISYYSNSKHGILGSKSLLNDSASSPLHVLITMNFEWNYAILLLKEFTDMLIPDITAGQKNRCIAEIGPRTLYLLYKVADITVCIQELLDSCISIYTELTYSTAVVMMKNSLFVCPSVCLYFLSCCW